MSIAGFLILLAIAVLLRYIGNKLVPVVMPTGWLKTIALGWAGGFLGSWVDSVWWQFGPQVGGINLVTAIIGCALFIFFLGIAPFIKIWLGKV
jgi:uncharacterized membrane protein YeaQ/YmgE (transglycosylase-associated protein family)